MGCGNSENSDAAACLPALDGHPPSILCLSTIPEETLDSLLREMGQITAENEGAGQELVPREFETEGSYKCITTPTTSPTD